MNRLPMGLLASAFIVTLGTARLCAGHRELSTVEQSIEVLRANSALAVKAIAPAALRDARGVAIIPHVVKAGLVVDREFGRGVVLVRQPDGSWSDPLFVTLTGGGIGLEAGIESVDLVLVFKGSASLDRILKGKGKLTLGTDVSVAAGPLGRDLEVAAGKTMKADVHSYSRSRGLFAGVSVQGAQIKVDARANEGFYNVRAIRPQDVLARRLAGVPAVESLKTELNVLSGVPVVVPVPTPLPPAAIRR